LLAPLIFCGEGQTKETCAPALGTRWLIRIREHI